MAFVQFLSAEARRIASEDVRLHARRDGLQLAGAFLLFKGLFRSYRPLPQKLDEIFHLGNLIRGKPLDSFDQQLCLHSSYIVTRPVQPAPVSAPLSTDHSADRIPRACNVMQGAIDRIDPEGAGDARIIHVRPLTDMNAHHRSIAKLFVAATLLLSLARLSFSQPIDLSGWEKSRWGMSDKDLIAVFGSRLQKLSKRQAFYKWHTDYVIPVELAGESYTVFFQMADDTDKLSQVLVRLNEMKSRTPREDLFNALASALAHDYGEPDAKTNDRYRFSSKFNGLELSHTWR